MERARSGYTISSHDVSLGQQQSGTWNKHRTPSLCRLQSFFTCLVLQVFSSNSCLTDFHSLPCRGFHRYEALASEIPNLYRKTGLHSRPVMLHRKLRECLLLMCLSLLYESDVLEGSHVAGGFCYLRHPVIFAGQA